MSIYPWPPPLELDQTPFKIRVYSFKNYIIQTRIDTKSQRIFMNYICNSKVIFYTHFLSCHHKHNILGILNVQEVCATKTIIFFIESGFECVVMNPIIYACMQVLTKNYTVCLFHVSTQSVVDGCIHSCASKSETSITD